MLDDVEDRHDVRVARQPGRRERLAAEPTAERLVLGEACGEHLDRDLAAELLVGRPVDVGHAAAREQLRLAVARGEVRVDGRHA